MSPVTVALCHKHILYLYLYLYLRVCHPTTTTILFCCVGLTCVTSTFGIWYLVVGMCAVGWGDVWAGRRPRWRHNAGLSPFLRLRPRRRHADGSRGMHVHVPVAAGSELLAVPEGFFVTDVEGRATLVGRAMASSGFDFQAQDYITVLLLGDAAAGDSPWSPFYALLPAAHPDVPLFWPPHVLALAAPSHLAASVARARAHLDAT